MVMRVTQSMTSAKLIQNLNTNMRKMASLQEQTATSRKINRPSDDPAGMTYGLRYRSDLSANTQYQSNVSSSLSWLEFYDSQLDQATQVLQRVNDLVVQGSTGTNTPQSLESINKEILELKKQMADIANSSFNGKYVFNGQLYDQQPYPDGVDAKTVTADSGAVPYEIGQGITINVNLQANQIFGDADAAGTTDNVFSVFDRISAALSSGSYTGVNAEIAQVKSRLEKISSARAENGAKTNRAELMKNRLDEMEVGLTGLQSRTEDADVEKLYIDSTVTQNIYQASLSVGAKIITPSLVNFLN